VRTVVAMEPRLYGEAVADAIRNRRPHLEVKIVEPDELGVPLLPILAIRRDLLPSRSFSRRSPG
jgi:hypothetical protein